MQLDCTDEGKDSYRRLPFAEIERRSIIFAKTIEDIEKQTGTAISVAYRGYMHTELPHDFIASGTAAQCEAAQAFLTSHMLRIRLQKLVANTEQHEYCPTNPRQIANTVNRHLKCIDPAILAIAEELDQYIQYADKMSQYFQHMGHELKPLEFIDSDDEPSNSKSKTPTGETQYQVTILHLCILLLIHAVCAG